MIEILIALLVPVLIVGGIVFLAAKRGLQMKELCEHGVEVTAQVLEKRSVRNSNSSSRQQKLVYRYTDSTGTIHEHTSVMPGAVYESYDEGGDIAVVYSAKRPSVSAPKYLVDQARAALGK